MKLAGLIIGVISIVIGFLLLVVNLYRHFLHYRRDRVVTKNVSQQHSTNGHDLVEMAKGAPNTTHFDRYITNFDDNVDEPLNEEIKAEPVRIHQPKPKPSRDISNRNVLVLYVLAKAGHLFTGYELLQALSAVGMRFGAMNIFHRYSEPEGQGEILFSAASAIKPGTFDLGKLGGLQCAGLNLFMQFSDSEDNRKIFDLMLAAATQLSEDLDGALLDAQRKLLDPARLEIYYQRIEQFSMA